MHCIRFSKSNIKKIHGAGTAVRVALALCVFGVLTGCGKANDNISAAYERLAELDYDGALGSLSNAESAGEDMRQIERARGIAYIGKADYPSAAESLISSLHSGNGYPDDMDLDTNYYLAAAYDAMSDYASAEDRYNAIIDISDDTDCYLLRASVRLKQGDYEGALGDFKVVRSRTPGDYDTLINIYEMLSKSGYKEAGLEFIESAMSDTSAKMTDSERGRMYYYMGEYTQAAALLESARNSDTTVVSSLFLGRTYEAMGEYNYAANVYESYIGSKGANSELYDQLGLCRLKMGEYEAALEAFRAGLEADDGSFAKSLEYNIAVAFEYISDFETARSMLTDYVAKYPDDDAAVRELEFLSTR